MSFYFWLIHGEGRHVLIDSGISPDQVEFPHYGVDAHPRDLLARLDVRPEDIGRVILTHFHFDHIGNVGLFSSAWFTVARAELDFWTGPTASSRTSDWAG
jgi:glyoxylase-like metal-dependent hydrolase (beta-lactamase superfamily II)